MGKTAWPVHPAAFYPFPFDGVAAWKVAAAAVVLAGMAFAAWIVRRTHPWIATGWIWYAVMLFPVIGIVQAGMQAMADRYMYLPMIGLLIPIAWELARFAAARWAAPLALAALAALTWQQISYWRDGVTLWTHALAVTRDNFVAHDNLGVELDALGRADEALEQYRETLRIRPQDRHGQSNYAQASFAKGERLFTSGHPADALAAFREGLRYRPGNAPAHSYVGAILTESGNPEAAIGEFRQALGIDPDLARAYMGLGVALARTGRVAEAERALRQSIARDSSSVEAFYDLGLIEAAQGRRADAIAAMERALRIDPNYAPAREAMAALTGHGR
jgi:protein O-mannosyl-transferase